MNGWLGRVTDAFRAGVQAYNQKSTVPAQEFGWDTRAARLMRYALYEAYDNSTIYSSIQAFASRLKLDHRLYRHIRAIYNPVSRQKRLIRANVYKGALDLKDLSQGGLPLDADQRLHVPLTQLFKWSRLAQQLGLYVEYAALLGDVALWIVDDRERQKVRLEVLHPGKIKDAELDDVGNVKAAVIEYQKPVQPDVSKARPSAAGVQFRVLTRDTYTYTMIVNQERFQTFYDGKPYDYINNSFGGPFSSWDNEYGFVPLKLGVYEDGGLMWGRNAFYNGLGKINEINDQASILDDSVRRVIEPLLKALNVTPRTNAAGQTEPLQVTRDDRAGVTILYVNGEKADVQPLTIPIDIAAASDNIKNMLDELERDMPELVLQRMREQISQPTAPGVQALYSDAIGRIEAARQSLDPTLVEAFQMAISIGAYNGYDGFQGFDLGSYARGDLEMTIRERPVIGDALSKNERITALQGMGNAQPAVQRLILKELDYSEDEIEQVVAEATETQQQQIRNAARGLADSLFGDEEDEDDADTETDEGDTSPEAPAEAQPA